MRTRILTGIAFVFIVLGFFFILISFHSETKRVYEGTKVVVRIRDADIRVLPGTMWSKSFYVDLPNTYKVVIWFGGTWDPQTRFKVYNPSGILIYDTTDPSIEYEAIESGEYKYVVDNTRGIFSVEIRDLDIVLDKYVWKTLYPYEHLRYFGVLILLAGLVCVILRK